MLSLNSNIEETNANIILKNIYYGINANPTKMKQLFQNLISNAIKFRKQTVYPEIIINCEPQEDFWKFSISDNGISISQDNQNHVFSIFKRFHYFLFYYC